MFSKGERASGDERSCMNGSALLFWSQTGFDAMGRGLRSPPAKEGLEGVTCSAFHSEFLGVAYE